MNKNIKIGLIVTGVVALSAAAYFYFKKKNVVTRQDEGKLTGTQIETLGSKALETLGTIKAEKQAGKTSRQQARVDVRQTRQAAKTAKKIKRGKLTVQDLAAVRQATAKQQTA